MLHTNNMAIMPKHGILTAAYSVVVHSSAIPSGAHSHLLTPSSLSFSLCVSCTAYFYAKKSFRITCFGGTFRCNNIFGSQLAGANIMQIVRQDRRNCAPYRLS